MFRDWLDLIKGVTIALAFMFVFMSVGILFVGLMMKVGSFWFSFIGL